MSVMHKKCGCFMRTFHKERRLTLLRSGMGRRAEPPMGCDRLFIMAFEENDLAFLPEFLDFANDSLYNFINIGMRRRGTPGIHRRDF